MKWPPCLNLVTMLLVTTSVRAQAPPSASPTAPATLAGALSRANAPANGVALAVQADQVQGSADTSSLEPHASITQVGDAYGRMVRRFGNVTAVAPLTMTIFNNSPGDPNIYADLRTEEIAKLLAADLNSTQWQMLTSDHGLGYSDLVDDSQRQRFTALFPEEKLSIRPRGGVSTTVQDLSQELTEAHLRLCRNTDIYIALQGINPYDSPCVSPPGRPLVYDLVPALPSKGSEFGSRYKAERANVLKPSDLDYSSPRLHMPVAVAGLKTVHDLVAGIARQTHLELYVDSRYGNQKVTWAGHAPSAYASDLLRALSLCLTSTWRQVGPAFVLTHDTVGLGATREIWNSFELRADILKKAQLDKAGDKLVTLRSAQSLRAFGDPLALTPDQFTAWNKDNPDSDLESTPYLTLPVNRLDSAQQAAVQTSEAELTKNPLVNADGSHLPDPSGKIGIRYVPTLQLLLPSLDRPVEIAEVDQLFDPSAKMRQQIWDQRHPSSQTSSPLISSSALSVVLSRIPQRAIMTSAGTLPALKPIVAVMKRFGFNQLWVLVFSEGRSYPDRLTAALKATKGSGITVFPVMNLLRWGLDAPKEAYDLTILGQTSAQMEWHNQQAQYASTMMPSSLPVSEPTSLLVAPDSPPVAETLANAVRCFGSHSGVIGLVWQETAALGYTDTVCPYRFEELGYSLSVRLAFLRRFQVDPIDLIDLGSGLRADIGMPAIHDSVAPGNLYQQWQQYRNGVDLGLLKRLSLADAGHVPPRILIAQQNTLFGPPWYGSWDGPNARVPKLHFGDDREGQQPAFVQAKSQSKIALTTLSSWPGMTPDSLASQLTGMFDREHWDGVALDIGNGQDFLPLGNRRVPPSINKPSGPVSSAGNSL